MQMKNYYIKDTKYVTFNPSELAKNINLCKHMVFFLLTSCYICLDALKVMLVQLKIISILFNHPYFKSPNR